MSAPGVLPSSGHAAPGSDVVVPLPDLAGWRPRLVATDLDGTLLDSTGAVTPRTRAALEACWDAGIPVVGVTGRGPRLLDSVRVALDGRGVAVLAQGGFVVDLERDEVLRAVGLPRAQRARELGQEVQGRFVNSRPELGSSGTGRPRRRKDAKGPRRVERHASNRGSRIVAALRVAAIPLALEHATHARGAASLRLCVFAANGPRN